MWLWPFFFYAMSRNWIFLTNARSSLSLWQLIVLANQHCTVRVSHYSKFYHSNGHFPINAVGKTWKLSNLMHRIVNTRSQTSLSSFSLIHFRITRYTLGFVTSSIPNVNQKFRKPSYNPHNWCPPLAEYPLHPTLTLEIKPKPAARATTCKLNVFLVRTNILWRTSSLTDNYI